MPEKVEWNGATKLSDLLSAYPWLKEELVGVNEKFRLLQSPLGGLMVHKATISEMSRRSGMEELVLIEKLQRLIISHKA